MLRRAASDSQLFIEEWEGKDIREMKVLCFILREIMATEDPSCFLDSGSSQGEEEREREREELRSIETDRPLWEELLVRKMKLLHSVDGCTHYEAREAIDFKMAISPVGSVLMAISGSPGVASFIARTFGCTHASYDVVRACASDMDDMLYQEVLLEIASSQLSLGHSVVIDIPLSCSRKHLDRLLEVADSCSAPLIVLIDIEVSSQELDYFGRETAESAHIPAQIYDVNDIAMFIFIDDSHPLSWCLRRYEYIPLQFILSCMDIDSKCQGGVVSQSIELGKGMLRHFSHRHPLVLEEFRVSNVELANCCICTALVDTNSLCYACRSCNFLVHKSCAQLPQSMQIPFHKHPLRLTLIPFESEESFSFGQTGWFPRKSNTFQSSLVRRRHSFSERSCSLFSEEDSYLVNYNNYSVERGILSCIICDSARKRPFYRCWECHNFFVHYECATSPHTHIFFDHKCHPHTLRLETYTYSRRGYIYTCCACGSNGSAISYCCLDCEVDFHVKCVLQIPHSALHKRHLHPLLLSASPEDDGNEYFCDICEKERHPDYWIYHCEPCRYEAHLSCANPDIPPYRVGLERLTHTVRRNSSSPCLPLLLVTANSRSSWGISRTSSLDSVESPGHTIYQGSPAGDSQVPEQLLAQQFPDTATTDIKDTLQGNCVHAQILSTEDKENVVPVIIGMKGCPCTGRSTMAQLLAKALRCTLINYERIQACLLRAERHHSTSECLPYQVLWRIAETHLRRNHHVVIDSPLSERDHFERLLCLAEQKDAILVIVKCAPKDEDVIVTSFYKPASGKDLEALSKGARQGHTNDDFDTSILDVKKLVVNERSIQGLEERINDAVKKLVLSCLVDKFHVEAIEPLPYSNCVLCRACAVRHQVADLPTSFKHEVCGHEFQLVTNERIYAHGKSFCCHCNGCAGFIWNIYYYCTTCELTFHPKCALELPLTIKHECHGHALTLTFLPGDGTDECACDVCFKLRSPRDWIYYCQECLFEAHVACVSPEGFSFKP